MPHIRTHKCQSILIIWINFPYSIALLSASDSMKFFVIWKYAVNLSIIPSHRTVHLLSIVIAWQNQLTSKLYILVLSLRRSTRFGSGTRKMSDTSVRRWGWYKVQWDRRRKREKNRWRWSLLEEEVENSLSVLHTQLRVKLKRNRKSDRNSSPDF